MVLNGESKPLSKDFTVQTPHENLATSSLLKGISDIGPRFSEDILKQTIRLYEPYGSKSFSPHKIELDVSYGEHPRQVLDLYESDEGAPLLLFVHGGGFVAGGKKINELFYSNVGHYFARHGVAVAMMNYRLAPEFTWPSAANDIVLCLNWLKNHRPKNQKLIVVGQSAGAAHVATYLTDNLFFEHAGQHVAGAVLMSGFYNTLSPMSPGAKSYFGDDAVLLEQRSPILKVANLKIPVLLTLAQFDPPGIALQTLALASQITQIQQAAPPLNCLAGHNHVSTVLSIGSPQKEVGELLIKYVRYFSQLGSVQ
jgi:dienelactone hydrolase